MRRRSCCHRPFRHFYGAGPRPLGSACVESRSWAVMGEPRGPLEALPLVLACSGRWCSSACRSRAGRCCSASCHALKPHCRGHGRHHKLGPRLPSAASEFLSSQGFLNAVIWFGGRKEPTIHCVDLVIPAGGLDTWWGRIPTLAHKRTASHQHSTAAPKLCLWCMV